MLNKTERLIVKTILDFSGEKETVLITRAELLDGVNARARDKTKLDESSLDEKIRELELDGYFDVIDSYRKDEQVYCITLRGKARHLPREEEQVKRKVVFDLKVKIALAITGAVIAFVITLLLNMIKHC